ncbi:MAG: SRPBCC family protein [Jiangellales bacterium]
MTESFQVSADVDAPAQATWSVLTDWERQSEWALLTHTRGIGPTGGQAVGEEVHAFTGVGRLGFMDTMVIEVWDPPQRCRVRKTGRVVRGASEFRVEALGPHRSRVVYAAEVEVPGGRVGLALWPVARAAIAAGFGRSLTTLAGIAEAESSSRLRAAGGTAATAPA